MNILLDYFFPIQAIEPTPDANTGFLKQVCVVVKPASMVTTGVITACVSMTEVSALTGNTEAQQLFDAGLNRVFILPMDDLDLADALLGHENDFFTVLISSDFGDSDIVPIGGDSVVGVKAHLKIQDITYTAKSAGVAGNSTTINYNSGGTAGAEGVSVTGPAITVTIEDGVSTATQIATAIAGNTDAHALVDLVVDSGDEADVQAIFGAAVPLAGGVDAVLADGLTLGLFGGVVGVSSVDDDFLADQAAIENRAAFHTTSGNKAKNMFFAFGKMLSNSVNWRNQQYITMPVQDDVDTVGAALNLFDDKISFVITDDQYGNRLALFAAGGKAIVAPYIKKNLAINLQSAALTYISGNQPAYTKTQGALLEDELQKVILSYIARGWIGAGVIEIKLLNDNFVASGFINIAQPKAMWRVEGEMLQTL